MASSRKPKPTHVRLKAASVPLGASILGQPGEVYALEDLPMVEQAKEAFVARMLEKEDRDKVGELGTMQGEEFVPLFAASPKAKVVEAKPAAREKAEEPAAEESDESEE